MPISSISISIRIETRYFVGGVTLENNKVVRAPPCFKKMMGWSRERVIEECKRQRWIFQELTASTKIRPNLDS